MADGDLTLYDGLFLMNPEAVGTDLAGAINRVREILERHGAEIVSLRKWDDRRLAYPIAGQKRGLYILSLFRMAGGSIAPMERDCQLSEEVARVMVIRGDHLGEVEIEQERKAAETTQAEANLRGAGEEGEAASAANAPRDAPAEQG
ncbi:MAG: 30S ribosomal protein S6 [Phycisphaeraceae bacterium]